MDVLLGEGFLSGKVNSPRVNPTRGRVMGKGLI